ncbi:hypothetical protein D3C78_1569490 [compost metagenome]
MELDRLEVAIALCVLQRVVVDDFTVQRLVILTERRSRELQAGLVLERSLYPVPSQRGHMVRFIDD